MIQTRAQTARWRYRAMRLQEVFSPHHTYSSSPILSAGLVSAFCRKLTTMGNQIGMTAMYEHRSNIGPHAH